MRWLSNLVARSGLRVVALTRDLSFGIAFVAFPLVGLTFKYGSVRVSCDPMRCLAMRAPPGSCVEGSMFYVKCSFGVKLHVSKRRFVSFGPPFRKIRR